MNSKRKVIVTKERNVTTYAEMWHTSYCLLVKGQEELRMSVHQFRASLVFSAFTLEAYLNHIGAKIFSCWEELEVLRNTNIRIGDEVRVFVVGDTPAGDFKIVMPTADASNALIRIA